MPSRRLSLLVLVVLVVGCGKQKLSLPPRAKTGAEEVANHFFSALIRKDWSAAYEILDVQSQSFCQREEFTRRGVFYFRDLEFEPTRVHVLACDERGEEAIAHVNLVARTANSSRSHKDAVGLRKQPAGWAVVLPDYFGRPRAKKMK